MNELVTKIYKDGRYKSICKRIAKKQDLAEELHSTFILCLLEAKEQQVKLLNTLNESGGLEVYCVGMINNIWKGRYKVKNQVRGSTSPLFEYSSTLEIIPKYNEDSDLDPVEYFNKPSEDYNFTIDYISNEARDLIDKECEHQELARMYKARVFKYSYMVYKNPDQFAKKVGIPRASIRLTCYQFRDYLKSKLKL